MCGLGCPFSLSSVDTKWSLHHWLQHASMGVMCNAFENNETGRQRMNKPRKCGIHKEAFYLLVLNQGRPEYSHLEHKNWKRGLEFKMPFILVRLCGVYSLQLVGPFLFLMSALAGGGTGPWPYEISLLLFSTLSLLLVDRISEVRGLQKISTKRLD